MNKIIELKLLPFLITLTFAICFLPSAFAQHWNSFRGPQSSGVFDGANLPEKWNGKTGENVQWKTAIPGIGMSSPVIWGDKLLVTSAVSNDDKSGLKPGLYGDITPIADTSVHDWIVYCLDTKTGDVLWQQIAHTGVPKQKRHPMSSHASASMATDGEYAVAFFGSEGLYCYNMEGDLQWKNDYGVLRSVFFAAETAEWEWASSPIIHDGVVLIQVDVMDQSFVAALDIRNGKELWRTNRDEDPTWCTPNIYKVDGRTRVVLNGYKHRGAYDFKTGEEVWRMKGGGDIPIPTPQVSGQMIYFNTAHGRMAPIFAVKTSAVGDISLKEGEETNEYVAWSHNREGAYMASMLVYNDLIYVGRWNGSFGCFDAKTGELYYKETLARGKSFTGSPVAADGKIYFTNDEGTVYVMQAGKEFHKLTELQLGETCMVTPAIKKNQIFFRTIEGIMAISSSKTL